MIPGRHYAGPVFIDLHTHSTASDGTEPPAVVVAQAVAAGLDVVALTDHDTTLGWEDAATSSIEHALDAGFFKYLTKPIKVGEFMAALDVALESATAAKPRGKA